jgi:hypothetical protein
VRNEDVDARIKSAQDDYKPFARSSDVPNGAIQTDHTQSFAIPAFERVKELKSGWIGPVRPSRQPLCGFLRMR